MTRHVNCGGIDASLARDGSEYTVFNAPIFDELRAEMRRDRRGVSATRSAAAVEREAAKREAARAPIRARAEWMREGLGL